MSVRIVRLEDVCEINPRAPKDIKDDTPVSFLSMSAVSEDGHVSFEETRTYGEVKKGYTYFERGDVLVAKITPCFENGKAASTETIQNELGFGSTEFHVLRPSKDLNPKYVFYLIWSERFRKIGEKGMTGSAGQKRVPADLLRRLEIPLPPLDEQKRIAAILDKADALRAKRRQAIALLDSLAQSIFLEMFGDPVSNPNGWPTRAVHDLCKLVRGSSPRPQGDARYFGGPVPRLLIADITRDGWLVTPKIDSLTIEGAKKSRFSPRGTVVMAVSGDVGLVAQLAIDACIHDGFVAFLDLDKCALEPQYFLNCLHLMKKLHAKGTAGAVFQNTTTTEIKNIQIPVPDLELQKQFIGRLLQLQQSATNCVTSVRETDSLFASLQHRAFTGQL